MNWKRIAAREILVFTGILIAVVITAAVMWGRSKILNHEMDVITDEVSFTNQCITDWQDSHQLIGGSYYRKWPAKYGRPSKSGWRRVDSLAVQHGENTLQVLQSEKHALWTRKSLLYAKIPKIEDMKLVLIWVAGGLLLVAYPMRYLVLCVRWSIRILRRGSTDE